ncbi:UNVERIFIED_CONTAM: hypothetical protein FKN15_033552 [Acipenser sinensis]
MANQTALQLRHSATRGRNCVLKMCISKRFENTALRLAQSWNAHFTVCPKSIAFIKNRQECRL